MKTTSVPGRRRELGVVELVARGRVAGDERDLRRDAAVGHRDPGRGGHGRRAPRRRARPRTGSPASASASASSPPRPKTNGSPPLSRTTSSPARPSSTSSSFSSAWPDVLARDHERVVGRLLDELGRDEHVVDERVAAPDQLEAAHGDEPGIAGPAPTSQTVTRASPSRAPRSSRAAPRRSRSAPSPRAAAPAAPRPARRARGPTSSAICERSRFASAGEAPPVETATAIGPSRCTAGRMKLQSSGTSATLQSIPRASASAWTRSFTARSEVAAITRNAPSRSLRLVAAARATRRRAPRTRRRSGETTVDRASQATSPLPSRARPPAADDDAAAPRHVEAGHVELPAHRVSTAPDDALLVGVGLDERVDLGFPIVLLRLKA